MPQQVSFSFDLVLLPSSVLMSMRFTLTLAPPPPPPPPPTPLDSPCQNTPTPQPRVQTASVQLQKKFRKHVTCIAFVLIRAMSWQIPLALCGCIPAATSFLCSSASTRSARPSLPFANEGRHGSCWGFRVEILRFGLCGLGCMEFWAWGRWFRGHSVQEFTGKRGWARVLTSRPPQTQPSGGQCGFVPLITSRNGGNICTQKDSPRPAATPREKVHREHATPREKVLRESAWPWKIAPGTCFRGTRRSSAWSIATFQSDATSSCPERLRRAL